MSLTSRYLSTEGTERISAEIKAIKMRLTTDNSVTYRCAREILDKLETIEKELQI